MQLVNNCVNVSLQGGFFSEVELGYRRFELLRGHIILNQGIVYKQCIKYQKHLVFLGDILKNFGSLNFLQCLVGCRKENLRCSLFVECSLRFEGAAKGKDYRLLEALSVCGVPLAGPVEHSGANISQLLHLVLCVYIIVDLDLLNLLQILFNIAFNVISL